MHIEHLLLENFRNHKHSELDLPKGCAVITGPNGQGKTNILEAAYFLATMGSWRAGDESDLVMAGETRARVGALVISEAGRRMQIDAELGERHRGFKNGKELGHRRGVAGVLRATLFAPEDLEIVKGGPGERRRFIDELISQIRPVQAGAKADFDRVLKQRNGLLKSLGGRSPATGTLDVWDEQFVKKGAELVAARRSAIAEMVPVAAAAYAEATGQAEQLNVEYACSFGENGDEKDLTAALDGARRDEIRRGLSLVGPQRDDLLITIEGRDARTRASQGEQRTTALALRLAEHKLIGDFGGEAGVLLLDDVFSELDPVRSRLLLTQLAGTQALVTSAGVLPEEVESLAEGRFEVRAGSVARRG